MTLRFGGESNQLLRRVGQCVEFGTCMLHAAQASRRGRSGNWARRAGREPRSVGAADLVVREAFPY